MSNSWRKTNLREAAKQDRHVRQHIRMMLEKLITLERPIGGGRESMKDAPKID
jgi:hypothetical protein